MGSNMKHPWTYHRGWMNLIFCHMSFISLSYIKQYKFLNTADPWTTWIWTAWVHLYVFFFFNKYCSTTPSILVESADEEPWVQRDLRYVGQTLNYTRIFNCEEGPCPYPVLFKGPLYSEKHLSPSLPAFLPSGAGVSSLCFRHVLQRYVSINHIHHCFECF